MQHELVLRHARWNVHNRLATHVYPPPQRQSPQISGGRIRPAGNEPFVTGRPCAGLSLRGKRSRFPGMSATLTIHLDSDVLQSAEHEARARHTTLPEVIAQQFRVMAQNWQDSRAGRTPVTDALRGAVKLPPDFDERATLTEELQKKHGVQG